MNIAGWLTDTEATALRDAAEGRLVLELGSYLGRSTAVLAAVARHVVAVDHHRGSSEHQGEAVFGDPWGTLPGFLANLAPWRSKLRLLVMDIEEAQHFLPANAFDFAFVDASHDGPSVARDGRVALRSLRPGGLAYFHDVVIGNQVYAAIKQLGRPFPVAGSIWGLEA